MNVSKSFLRDFAYLANLYNWDPADIADVKAQTRANPEPMRRYWTALARAHRAGYQQTPANGYERLRVWTDRNPAFVEQYARAREGISARIAHAREAQPRIIISYRTPT
jgi:hypothetical protein